MTDTISSPIFIVGPGRSGTTLMRTILSAHSRLSIAPETQFMNRAKGSGLRQGAPPDFDKFWKEYTGWVRFKDLDVDPSACRELILKRGEPTYRNIFQSVLAVYQRRTGKPRVGEKSPSHVNYLSELLDWFPDGRVLVMLRDPRAVVASQLGTHYVRQQMDDAGLSRGTGSRRRPYFIAYYAGDWKRIFSDVMSEWEPDPRVRIVRYEDLVGDAESVVADVCSFLGEHFEPQMLEDRSSKNITLPAGELPDRQFEHWRREHQSKALKPVSTDSIEKWKTSLDKNEVRTIEGICGSAMADRGYPFTTGILGRSTATAIGHSLVAIADVEKRMHAAARTIRNYLRGLRS